MINSIEDLLMEVSSITNYTKHEFKITESDAKLLSSLAKQVGRDLALTDRQYQLALSKLSEMRSQFEEAGIDYCSAIKNAELGIRTIDRSKWVRVVEASDISPLRPPMRKSGFMQDDPDTTRYIGVRFNFNKNLIKLIEKLRSAPSITSGHTRYYPYTESNIAMIMEVVAGRNFEIDDEILAAHTLIKEFEANRASLVPGVYNHAIHNVRDSTKTALVKLLGKPVGQNIALYYDRRMLYGLEKFDIDEVHTSLSALAPLTKSIAVRQAAHLLVNANTWTYAQFFLAMSQLKRYPMLILLDPDDALAGMELTHPELSKFVSPEEVAVMYRADSGKGDNFNKYVKDNRLNNSVDKNTKVVYLSKNKLPKPIVQSGWRPSCCLLITSSRLTDKVNTFIEGLDLVIHYDTQSTSWVSFGKAGGIEEIQP